MEILFWHSVSPLRQPHLSKWQLHSWSGLGQEPWNPAGFFFLLISSKFSSSVFPLDSYFENSLDSNHFPHDLCWPTGKSSLSMSLPPWRSSLLGSTCFQPCLPTVKIVGFASLRMIHISEDFLFPYVSGHLFSYSLTKYSATTVLLCQTLQIH